MPPDVTETITRRQQVADAAIATLAREGMRGLTHRAVDQTAGLPEGSCSYYFRTRQALLQATVERLVEIDTADLTERPAILGHPPTPANPTPTKLTPNPPAPTPNPGRASSEGGGGGAEPVEVAEAAAEIIRYWTTFAGERMKARYELMLEASRRPELQAVLDRARQHYHQLAEATLVSVGATDPAAQAQVLIACLDGLVFRHLTGADPLTGPPEQLTKALLDLLHGFIGRHD